MKMNVYLVVVTHFMELLIILCTFINNASITLKVENISISIILSCNNLQITEIILFYLFKNFSIITNEFDLSDIWFLKKKN